MLHCWRLRSQVRRVRFPRLLLVQAAATTGAENEVRLQSVAALMTKTFPDKGGRGRRVRSQGVLERLGHLRAGLAHPGYKTTQFGPVFRELLRSEKYEGQDQEYENFRDFNAHRRILFKLTSDYGRNGDRRQILRSILSGIGDTPSFRYRQPCPPSHLLCPLWYGSRSPVRRGLS